MKKKNKHYDLGFEIPDGYFENAMDRMLVEKEEPEIQENPFVVPAAYFAQLEDRVLKNTIARKTLSENDPAGFTVPEGYFEQLESSVIAKTIDKPVVQLKSEYHAWVIPMLAVAAIFIAVIAISGFWNTESFSMEDLGKEELGTYLAETEFTTDHDAIEILYFSDAAAIDNVAFNNSIDSDVLLDYLADEVDLNQMMEE